MIKKMIIAINDHGQSFWFKQTQHVVYKFDTICKMKQIKLNESAINNKQ